MSENNINMNQDTIANLPLYRVPDDLKAVIVTALNYYDSTNILNIPEIIKARLQKSLNEPFATTSDLKNIVSPNDIPTEINKTTLSAPKEIIVNNKIINGNDAFVQFIDRILEENKNNVEFLKILKKIQKTYTTLLKDVIDEQ